jgi:cutinase
MVLGPYSGLTAFSGCPTYLSNRSPGSMAMPSHDEMFSAAHLSYLKVGMPGQAAVFAADHL